MTTKMMFLELWRLKIFNQQVRHLNDNNNLNLFKIINGILSPGLPL
jgi:hypothetical protein